MRAERAARSLVATSTRERLPFAHLQRTLPMTVEHDAPNDRFVVHLPDGDAELLYARPDERTIDLQHTEVPASARGQGVADELARAAFEYVREQGLQVVVTCPFVRTWLRRHPEERSMVSGNARGA